MKNNCCYWSVVDGSYVGMMAACIRSAREVGVFKDFHVWSPRPVEGATTHYIANLDKTLCLFKLLYLRDEVSKLPYVEFWNVARKPGYLFTEEAPMAYAAHMLCGNPYEHTLKETSDLWASDWTGAYAGRLPDGQPWSFQDYFNAERFKVNPAIVHAMRSKEALVGSAGGD